MRLCLEIVEILFPLFLQVVLFRFPSQKYSTHSSYMASPLSSH
jgi:hypothetical protein